MEENREEQQQKMLPFKLKEVRLAEDQCSVCLDDLMFNGKGYRSQCEHLFHLSCLRRWLRVRDSCPDCRREQLRRTLPKVKKPSKQVSCTRKRRADKTFYPLLSKDTTFLKRLHHLILLSPIESPAEHTTRFNGIKACLQREINRLQRTADNLLGSFARSANLLNFDAKKYEEFPVDRPENDHELREYLLYEVHLLSLMLQRLTSLHNSVLLVIR